MYLDESGCQGTIIRTEAVTTLLSLDLRAIERVHEADGGDYDERGDAEDADITRRDSRDSGCWQDF